MRNNPGERERSVEALLRRQREDAVRSPATETCVDGETLAAWMDDGLASEDLAAVERHCAGCARCQAMLASMARIAPPIAPRAWWRGATIKWLTPVAAAAALALWVSVDRQQNRSVAPAAQTSTSRAAEAVAPSAPSLDERPRLQAFKTADAAAPTAKTATSADAVTRRETPPEVVARGGEPARSNTPALPSLPARSDNAASIATPAAATPAPAAARPPASPPSPAPVAGNTITPVPPLAVDALKPPSLAETVNVTSESPLLEKMAAGQVRAGIAFSTADILSPEPAFRWRMGAPGTILRSTDNGVTWTSQRTPAPVALAAGAAPARDVCWLVGGSGAVLLSTDGTTWQLRPFPEAVSLTAVRAVDSKTAVVTAADGRQFSTTDGGASWSLR